MDLGIERRVALVLGASRGLGRATAESLGREGARVALASRSAGSLEEVAAGIGGDTAVLPVDRGPPPVPCCPIRMMMMMTFLWVLA